VPGVFAAYLIVIAMGLVLYIAIGLANQ